MAQVARDAREIRKSDLLAETRQPRGHELRLGGIAPLQGGLKHGHPVGEVKDHLLDHLTTPLIAQRLAQHQNPGRVEHRVLVRRELQKLCTH